MAIEALKNKADANKQELREIFSRIPELSEKMGEIAINVIATGVWGDVTRSRAELVGFDSQIANLLERNPESIGIYNSEPMISMANLRFDLIEKYGRPEPKSEDELE